MSFLSALFSFKNKFTFKQLTVLFICLLFVQYKCDASSTDDDEEDEDTVDVEKNPESLEDFNQIPDDKKNSNFQLPKKQYTLSKVSKPRKTEKGNALFRARNYLFGDYRFLPVNNQWMVILKIILALTRSRRRERRNLEDMNVDCRNMNDIPNTIIDESKPKQSDFTCISEKNFTDENLDDYNMTISKVDGEEPSEEIAKLNLMDITSEDLVSPKDSYSFIVNKFTKLEDGSLLFTGDSDPVTKFKDLYFAIIFDQPEGKEANCKFNGSEVSCTPKSTIRNSEISDGIIFDKDIVVGKDGKVIENTRRLQESNIAGEIHVGTLGKPATNSNNGTTSLTPPNDSSGLSGGAIAGIIIACAAVLIGGILAALLCRKTTTSTTIYSAATQDSLAIGQKPVYY